MNRLVAIGLSLVLSLTMIGCSSSEATSQENEATNTESNEAEKVTISSLQELLSNQYISDYLNNESTYNKRLYDSYTSKNLNGLEKAMSSVYELYYNIDEIDVSVKYKDLYENIRLASLQQTNYALWLRNSLRSLQDGYTTEATEYLGKATDYLNKQNDYLGEITQQLKELN